MVASDEGPVVIMAPGATVSVTCAVCFLPVVSVMVTVPTVKVIIPLPVLSVLVHDIINVNISIAVTLKNICVRFTVFSPDVVNFAYFNRIKQSVKKFQP